MTALPQPRGESLATETSVAEVQIEERGDTDKAAADALVDDARAARAKGDLRKASTALIEALKCHPGLQSTFREVGDWLADMGLQKASEQCFAGKLPDILADEWFRDRFTVALPDGSEGSADTIDAQVTPANVAATRVTRHLCYRPVTRKLHAPKGIRAPRDAMFSRKRVTSTLALVDKLDGGRLWFDGFNRVVVDAAGHLVDQHTRGTPSLVKAVAGDITSQHVAGRAFFVGNRGYNNYYHWMLDILPSIHLFERAGYEICPEDRVVVFTGSSSFQKGTLDALGISPEQIVQLSRSSPSLSADELVVPFYANSMALTMAEWVPAFLIEKFLPATAVEAGAQESDLPSRFYVARAKDARNGRSIDNEDELIAFLETRGFSAIYPEEHSVTTQARLFAGADIVLASHGAGLTNIAYCKPETKVVELYGNFINVCYWALSQVCRLDYYSHCCSTKERSVQSHQRSQKDLHELRQRGFSVDMAELGELLDLVEGS